jgi:hypothetical protein
VGRGRTLPIFRRVSTRHNGEGSSLLVLFFRRDIMRGANLSSSPPFDASQRGGLIPPRHSLFNTTRRGGPIPRHCLLARHNEQGGLVPPCHFHHYHHPSLEREAHGPLPTTHRLPPPFTTTYRSLLPPTFHHHHPLFARTQGGGPLLHNTILRYGATHHHHLSLEREAGPFCPSPSLDSSSAANENGDNGCSCSQHTQRLRPSTTAATTRT